MAISNLSHVARYVLLSEAAYANFIDNDTTREGIFHVLVSLA